jgi:hypothetical protein
VKWGFLSPVEMKGIRVIGDWSVHMTNEATTIEVEWSGPYSWPTYEGENNLPPLPSLSGVYLQTFRFQNGYLIYAAGLTRRPVSERFGEHTRKYMNGEYSVLDTLAVQKGIRREIWHGWGYARNNRKEFEDRKLKILEAVHKQLSGFRIFITDPGSESRVLERLEASIMGSLYKQPHPICDIPDKGMQLAPRWDMEDPIIVKNHCAVILHGLPDILEI